MAHCVRFLIVALALSTQARAFTCYITMVKDSCWTKYNVTVQVTDASLGTASTSIIVPEGQTWARKQFECAKGQTLALQAQFTPAFWRGDETKTFPAQRFWKLPDDVESGVTGWNVTVCYPKWFSDVPLPPEATGTCVCNTDNIPPVAPQLKS